MSRSTSLFPRVWIDGKVVPLRRARVRTDDAGLLFGWGVFETLRLYQGRPFDLEAHLSRMRRSARQLRIKANLSTSRIRRAVRSLVDANRIRHDAAMRISLTRGPEGGRATLFIQLRRLKPSPDLLRRRGLRVAVLPWTRHPMDPLVTHKTMNYLEHALAREIVHGRGFDEALSTDPRGRLLEGTWSSLFVVSRGRLLTPPLELGILPGITRAHVMKISRRLGHPARESPIRLRTLLDAAEAFVSSSAGEIIPIVRIDRRRIRQGTLWREIWSRYRAKVQARLGISVEKA
jgi:branched-chain amino acid aminotransferase